MWRFLKELKIDLPYDPTIALLGIYPKDTDAVKRQDTCTPMSLAAMSTVARLWKEPWCPSKDEWIKEMWFMYTMAYYSAIRNDEYKKKERKKEMTNTHHLLRRGWNWRVLC